MKELDYLVLELKSNRTTRLMKEVAVDNSDFARGMRLGAKDRLQGTRRDLSLYSAEFRRGYKKVREENTWDMINSRLTDLLARLGSSRLR